MTGPCSAGPRTPSDIAVTTPKIKPPNKPTKPYTAKRMIVDTACIVKPQQWSISDGISNPSGQPSHAANWYTIRDARTIGSPIADRDSGANE